MRQPGNRIALAAAGRVLHQVARAHGVGLGPLQQIAHDIELVIARPHLAALDAAFLVFFLDDLRIVLDYLGQRFPRQHLAPQVLGANATLAGNRRIAGATQMAAIEGQEPRALAGQLGAEAHFQIVHREMHRAAAELEQQLARVAIVLVLQHGVGHGLARVVVLQLEGRQRQAVDEQRKVERALRLVAAVAHLAGDAEDIGGEQRCRPVIARRRRMEVKLQRRRPVLDALAQHIHHTAAGDLALQAMQQLPCGAAGQRVGCDLELGQFLGLGRQPEAPQLAQVERHLAVVIMGMAFDVAGAAIGRRFLPARARRPAGEGGNDQAFQPGFTRVRRRHPRLPARPWFRLRQRVPLRPRLSRRRDRAPSRAHQFGR